MEAGDDRASSPQLPLRRRATRAAKGRSVRTHERMCMPHAYMSMPENSHFFGEVSQHAIFAVYITYDYEKHDATRQYSYSW